MSKWEKVSHAEAMRDAENALPPEEFEKMRAAIETRGFQRRVYDGAGNLVAVNGAAPAIKTASTARAAPREPHQTEGIEALITRTQKTIDELQYRQYANTPKAEFKPRYTAKETKWWNSVNLNATAWMRRGVRADQVPPSLPYLPWVFDSRAYLESMRPKW